MKTIFVLCAVTFGLLTGCGNVTLDIYSEAERGKVILIDAEYISANTVAVTVKTGQGASSGGMKSTDCLRFEGESGGLYHIKKFLMEEYSGTGNRYKYFYEADGNFVPGDTVSVKEYIGLKITGSTFFTVPTD